MSAKNDFPGSGSKTNFADYEIKRREDVPASSNPTTSPSALARAEESTVDPALNSQYLKLNKTDIMDFIRCPITLEPMTFPVSTSVCEHIFEKSAIEEYCAHQQNQNQDASCPMCRTPLDTELLVKNNLISKLIDMILTSNPEFAGEQHLDFKLFEAFLEDAINTGDRTLPEEVLRILPYKRNEDDNSQFFLNVIQKEGPHQHLSVLFLLSLYPVGRAALSRPNITRIIDPIALNAIIPEGEFQGQSVVFQLALTPEGRAILRNPRIARMIQPATLNAVIPAGEYQGQSASTILGQHRDEDQHEHKEQHEDKLKQSTKTLQTLGPFYRSLKATLEGTAIEKSTLFRIAGTKEGVAKLLQPHIMPLITRATLNEVVQEGPLKGQSVAFRLALTPEGRAMLRDPSISRMIKPATFNAVIPGGKYKGQSVQSILLEHEDEAKQTTEAHLASSISDQHANKSSKPAITASPSSSSSHSPITPLYQHTRTDRDHPSSSVPSSSTSATPSSNPSSTPSHAKNKRD